MDFMIFIGQQFASPMMKEAMVAETGKYLLKIEKVPDEDIQMFARSAEFSVKVLAGNVIRIYYKDEPVIEIESNYAAHEGTGTYTAIYKARRLYLKN